MAFDSKKPIELETGWSYMDVSREQTTTTLSTSTGSDQLANPFLQDGISKLKRILEGNKTEVG